ncbi:MAG: iron-sulfur cluster repair di-iron protein [Saprospiraceae bacterium]|nr:iron-sulfur cluster repair di-iron protein [Saprospiraceae bacterium]
MNINLHSVIGELVANNYKTAQVFKTYKVDFCCNGNRTLIDLKKTDDIDLEKLIEDLEKVTSEVVDLDTQFKSWPLDLLTDYIEKTYHRYIEHKVPVIKEYLNKVCDVHGRDDNELYKIQEIFNASSEDLLQHMAKEEQILFPYIRKMVENEERGFSFQPPMFGSVKNPIHMMMEEHSTEGDRYKMIASLSNDYTPPAKACNTYMVVYAMLKEFEEKLHAHIHLENNILFPGAITFEQSIIHQQN